MKVYTSHCFEFLRYGLFSVSPTSNVHFLSVAYYYTVNLKPAQTETNKASPEWLKNKMSQCLVVTAQTVHGRIEFVYSVGYIHTERSWREMYVCKFKFFFFKSKVWGNF